MNQVQNLHIIIAEDDSDDSEIIEKCFDNHPSYAKITMVKNGKDLLDFLKNASEKPDVILTDINMPIVNGLEALKEISNNTELASITSFAYSTSINPIYRSKCLKYGATAFINKPFVLEEFDEIPKKITEIINSLTQ